MNNIEYIDLRNLTNEEGKNIENSLVKKRKFYICQTKEIINYPLVFNCCEYLTNIEECFYIPSFLY